MSDVQADYGKATTVDVNALKGEIRTAIINTKANACPMIVRLAWHASGTYSAKDNTGGSNGATMRFAPESEDDANAGLSIARDLLEPVAKAHPEISRADLWVAAGCVAIEFMGGPPIPFNFGRSDAPSGASCPVVGRLPDASQGAQHLRDVFYRMGFDDRDIVALSGAHTLGRCHETRSGFDGPWTRTPLKFNNSYYKLLLNEDWQPRKWDGPLQYEAEVSDWKLMMLPTDMVIKTDPKFRVWCVKYAADQKLFFKHFSAAFAKLIALGCPKECQPKARKAKPTEGEKKNAHFRELAMHGSVLPARELWKSGGVCVHATEQSSARNALHKSAFWGHDKMTAFLLNECKINVNTTDSKGDTPCHDAARFGHTGVVKQLVAAGADLSIKNKACHTALDLAIEFGKVETAKVLKATRSRL